MKHTTESIPTDDVKLWELLLNGLYDQFRRNQANDATNPELMDVFASSIMFDRITNIAKEKTHVSVFAKMVFNYPMAPSTSTRHIEIASGWKQPYRVKLFRCPNYPEPSVFIPDYVDQRLYDVIRGGYSPLFGHPPQHTETPEAPKPAPTSEVRFTYDEKDTLWHVWINNTHMTLSCQKTLTHAMISALDHILQSHP